MDGSSHASTTALFDANAGTYDRVNSIVSFGLDARWRTWAARRAVDRVGARVLDAFAGTGRTGLEAARLCGRVTLADASSGMLAVAQHEAARQRLQVHTLLTDLVSDPLPPGPFDAITMVFGVRYVRDPSAVIRRLSSLLVPGGRFVVLEFAEPNDGVISRLAAVYFFRILPVLAGALARRRALYRVLADTTHAIHGREHLEGIVRGAGLEVSEVRTMGFGLVVGIVGRVPTTDRSPEA